MSVASPVHVLLQPWTRSWHVHAAYTSVHTLPHTSQSHIATHTYTHINTWPAHTCHPCCPQPQQQPAQRRRQDQLASCQTTAAHQPLPLSGDQSGGCVQMLNYQSRRATALVNGWLNRTLGKLLYLILNGRVAGCLMYCLCAQARVRACVCYNSTSKTQNCST